MIKKGSVYFQTMDFLFGGRGEEKGGSKSPYLTSMVAKIWPLLDDCQTHPPTSEFFNLKKKPCHVGGTT